MWRTCMLAGSFVALGLLLAAAGCGSPRATEPAKSPAPRAPMRKPRHCGRRGGALEGLKELSAEDRAAAEKQRVCPVSGELLGSMGKPYKITVEGRTVFLCCSGCEEEFRKDPEKYFAKMKK